MSKNVPFKHPEGINECRALNTTDRVAIAPACRNDDVNGTRPPAGGHTSEARADPAYKHWCRPEPTREFPFRSATQEQYRERQGGMQDDTPGLKRASNGGVIGSQVGVEKPQGPHQQQTEWGEYNTLDQWDKPQEGTYGRGENRDPFDKD